jgi:hypothetical protein
MRGDLTVVEGGSPGGHIDDYIDYLASLAFAVYPRDSAEYHDARWTRVRLRFFLNVLRVKLDLRPQ